MNAFFFHLLSSKLLLPLCLLASLSTADETILGVYILSRHGDRTPKSLPPSNLTTLGYNQVYQSGQYYRNRYVASNATDRIAGLNPDIVKLSQLTVSAPVDNVLMNSAQGFLQALYPPLGSLQGNDASSSTQKLKNGTEVQAPMDGFQLIPVTQVQSGAGGGSEDSAWLQGSSNCGKAQVSSNEYLTSQPYQMLYDGSLDFFQGLTKAVNGVFAQPDMNYKNAYAIFDLLNVATIHNTSFSALSTPDFSRLQVLANEHELGLAYNTTDSSDSVRAISGAVLAGEVLDVLNATLTTPSKAPRLNIQFNAYGTTMAFFGLVGLTMSDPDVFTGIPDYASSMSFEVFTTAAPPAAGASIDPKDVQVRWLWNNGSSAPSHDLQAYPLFGSHSNELTWEDFSTQMGKIAVSGQTQWCQACGNTTGVCSSTSGAPPAGQAASKSSSGGGSGGVSKPVAGVIGAMVTLAVILGIEALALLLFGLRVVRKRRGTAAGASGTTTGAGNGAEKGTGNAAS